MDNKEISCICTVLEEIRGFSSISEFERFQKYINGLIDDGELIEISVRKRYAGFPEQWYKCKSCALIWRLVHPDFPFKGLWLKVERSAEYVIKHN